MSSDFPLILIFTDSAVSLLQWVGTSTPPLSLFPYQRPSLPPFPPHFPHTGRGPSRHCAARPTHDQPICAPLCARDVAGTHLTDAPWRSLMAVGTGPGGSKGPGARRGHWGVAVGAATSVGAYRIYECSGGGQGGRSQWGEGREEGCGRHEDSQSYLTD